MATSQTTKQRLGIAGEYGVCSELSKRGYNVSLTMGNSKAVDVLIFKNKSVRKIEVKTSSTGKFVTNFFKNYWNKSNKDHPDFWVLVHIDKDNISHYYVLTHDEMGDTQMKRNGATIWKQNKTGVDNVTLKHIQSFKDKWTKIK